MKRLLLFAALLLAVPAGADRHPPRGDTAGIRVRYAVSGPFSVAQVTNMVAVPLILLPANPLVGYMPDLVVVSRTAGGTAARYKTSPSLSIYSAASGAIEWTQCSASFMAHATNDYTPSYCGKTRTSGGLTAAVGDSIGGAALKVTGVGGVNPTVDGTNTGGPISFLIVYRELPVSQTIITSIP